MRQRPGHNELSVYSSFDRGLSKTLVRLRRAELSKDCILVDVMREAREGDISISWYLMSSRNL